MANVYVVSGRFDYHESIGGTRWYFGGGNCVRGYGNRINSTSCFVMNRTGESDGDKDYQTSNIKDMIWLPRQDQLQELFWDDLTKETKIHNFI
ncbi:hypothetical protein [Paenibacillus sp. BIHB 4019]|uniref:hypothetical protein n=1 Tax=Paenibacillus sp. BIHB 4019 TaxID=1870819 RepID=UPI001F226CEC|nr:hypothetical protein [Paenibacillus sp. BIHB 4019]